MEQHKCQLPIVNKETGEVTPCEASDIKTFTYQGNDFYFCSKHYELFSKNIDNYYIAFQEEMEEYIDKNNGLN